MTKDEEERDHFQPLSAKRTVNTSWASAGSRDLDKERVRAGETRRILANMKNKKRGPKK
jgi:hypothetical protein